MDTRGIIEAVKRGDLTTDEAATLVAANSSNGNGTEVRLERKTGKSQKTGKPYAGYVIHGNHRPHYMSDGVFRSVQELADAGTLQTAGNGNGKRRRK